MQRLQTIQQRGYLLEEEMQSQGSIEMHSILVVSEANKNNMQKYTRRMIDAIVERKNMTLAI